MSKDEPALDSVQRWMQNALVFPRLSDRGETEQMVESSPRLSGADRLAIYQRSYYTRLLKCMEEHFPALRYVLGEELFNEFAKEYLRELPSQSYSLCELGKRLPAFLESTRPDRDRPEGERETWVNFMIDLARCEQDLYVMYDAPGHEGKSFASEAVPDSRLRLQPCFALHEYRFPVSWYYFQVKDSAEPELPPEGRSCVALLRKDYSIRTFPLSGSQYSFLCAMAEGKSADQALQQVAAESGRSMAKVAEAWSSPGGVRKRWLNAGFFIEAD